MHSMKAMMLLVSMLVLVRFAVAGNNPGIHDWGKIVLHTPTQVGDTRLPAGEYVVRRTNWFSLERKADQTLTAFQLNAANEPVPQELVFAGTKPSTYSDSD